MPKAREFVALTARFNALAQALETARAENVRLGHRLITAQDDERKRTAIELHDEVGPSLFGLRAIATSIGGVASELPAARDMLAERVRDMLDIIENSGGDQSRPAEPSAPDGARLTFPWRNARVASRP